MAVRSLSGSVTGIASPSTFCKEKMITFRQATRDDIPALSRILTLASCYEDVLWKDLNRHISGWVACAEGKPIGLALADRNDGRLLVVLVLQEVSGRGIGRELMKQAEAWLFSHGWSEISLTLPDESHTHSLGFFQHLGWNISQPDDDFYHLKKANPRSCIRLEEHFIDDPDTGYSRLVRFQRGPADKNHRLCLFLDGEHYWRDMDAIPLLNNLFEGGNLPPMTIALVGHVSGAARHDDYTCNEAYARFIEGAVIPWLKTEISGLDEGGHIICGLSLSGLMATYLTLLYPKDFTGCVSQSGSHWWKHEWFAGMARSKGSTDTKFWLSVGDQETDVNVKHPPTGLLQEISQIEGVEATARVLKEIGGIVHYHRYQGGHSIQCWRGELSDALQWVATEEMQNRVPGSS